MKLSLKLQPARPLTRAEAWGCFTANLALPGSGSLAAGRAVGYGQLALTALGFAVSLSGAAGFVRWYLSNPPQLNPGPNDDPLVALSALAHAALVPMAGIALFGFALAWAAWTGWQIVNSHPKPPPPPRII